MNRGLLVIEIALIGRGLECAVGSVIADKVVGYKGRASRDGEECG